MIYTLKRNRYDDEIVCDNMRFFEYDDITLNTKNIFSIEQYQDANNNNIYGLRINGIKYPLFDRGFIEWLVVLEEKDKDKHDFLNKLHSGYKFDYAYLPKQEQEWWDEYSDTVTERCNDEYIIIEEKFKEIIEIMQKENEVM